MKPIALAGAFGLGLDVISVTDAGAFGLGHGSSPLQLRVWRAQWLKMSARRAEVPTFCVIGQFSQPLRLSLQDAWLYHAA